jgi:hypothetical protein
VRVVSVSGRPIRAACPTTCPEVKGERGARWRPTPIHTRPYHSILYIEALLSHEHFSSSIAEGFTETRACRNSQDDLMTIK